MTRRLAFALALLLVPSPALAWGFKGHTMISRLGAAHFPASLPAFVRSQPAVNEIGYLGPEEDRLKGSGKSWDDDNDPGHYLDIGDDGLVDGVVSLRMLPPDMRGYERALARAHSNPYHAGFLPYEIMDGWEQVRTDFSIWRIDNYMAAHATTAQARRNFAQARAMRETLTLRDIGVWSHFVGDGSQPLHNTIHYNENGWHSKFESDFVDAHVSAADVAKAIAPDRLPSPSSLTSQPQIARIIGSYLLGSASQVKPLYVLANNGGFTNATPQAVAFTAKQLARGVDELRDLTTLAWQDSLNTKVGYPEISVRDVLAGKVTPRTPI